MSEVGGRGAGRERQGWASAGGGAMACVLAAAVAWAATTAAAEAATKRAFLSSTACSGDLGACSVAAADAGVAAANNVCQEAADLAGLTGGGQQFVAWLSDAATDAYCNALGLSGKLSDVPPCGTATLPAAGPWVRMDGVPFVLSLADMTSVGPLSTISVDENGVPQLTLRPFATGTQTDGTVANTSNLPADHTCADWTLSSGGSLWGGTSDATINGFASGASTGCTGPQRLLCLESGADGDPVRYPQLVAGALAFVSSESGTGDLAGWASSGGVGGPVGGDAVCQALAAAAGLPAPESFVAWLSLDGADASARLPIDGPWVRVDGIPVADSLADLTDQVLRSSIGIDETGARSEDDPWTGTSAVGTWSGSDCGGWMDGTSGPAGTIGHAWRSISWSDGGLPKCNEPHPIYCFGTVVVLGWDNFESGDFERWGAVQP